MMTNNHAPTNLPDSPFNQLLMFVLLVSVGYLVASFITAAIVPFFPNAVSETGSITSATFMRLAQTIQLTFMMFVPALVYVQLFGKHHERAMFMPPSSGLSVLLAAIAFVMALPFVDFMANLNRQLVLPGFLEGAYQWMVNSEKEIGELTLLLLDTKDYSTIILNIGIMAVLPAICEEFFFRGVLQQKLIAWFNRPIWAIVVTAFIFSALHFQFLTFLPRFIHGLALGYLFYASGSIWVAVSAHFMNNLVALLIFYYIKINYPLVDPMSVDTSSNNPLLILSSFIMASLLIVIAGKLGTKSIS